MKKRSGIVPLDELLPGFRPQNLARGHFTLRSVQPKAGEDWFRIVKNSHVEEGEDVSEVYIYDEIGFWGTDADSFVRQLLQIESPKIDLHLNSPGGEFFDGVAIYNALKMHPATVTTYVDALAASAASFIAQAGDKIIMADGSMMMIHDASGMTWGNAADHAKSAEVLDKISNIVASLYSGRAGETTEFWRALMLEEMWYTAQEAVDAKLADEVSGGTGDKPKDAWDLTIFNYAGRDQAPSPQEQRNRVIANRAREAPVSRTAVNHEETASPDTEGEDKETTPTTPASPAAPETEEVPAGGGASGSGAPLPESDASTATDPAQNRAVAQKFTMTFADGTVVTDAAEAQRRVAVLEQFAADTQTSNRKAFVKHLADEGKILASGMDEIEKFALSLSPETYDSWSASWNAVPKSTVLQSMATIPSVGASVVKDEADQIKVWEETVTQHQRGGMREEQIKQTASYKNLIAAKPDFKL